MNKTAWRDGRSGARRPLRVLLLAVAAPGIAAAQDAPKFTDYPGAAAYRGVTHVPVLASREARWFRTMIRNAARGKPNFNGHYIVATWGCGSDCEMGVIIDAISGKVVLLPVVAGSAAEADPNATHFDYRLDSRLLVMTGMINEKPPMGSRYFTFDGARLTPLTTVVKTERNWAPPSGEQRP